MDERSAADGMISILLVDDHAFLREGVAAVLQRQDDMRLVGEAENGEEAIERFRALKPDIVVMDLQMPGVGGLEAIAAIRADAPNAKIVVLTTFDGDVQAYRAMKAGASAYLLKSSLRKDLVDTVRAVHRGGRRLSPEIAEKIAMYAIDERLSEREIEVLRLISQGQPNKGIAHRLSITEATVKTHLKSIFLKLDVADRTHAVTVAARRGIITL
ncbi:response regulator transcription factor [Phenylobacterium sp.]|uniref:response regulator n=1 Tax=Phenylobacterium sp. TaxID=1871053 RepID=UPI00122A4D42|nr:response regulator transcription factor [Phenylobacterium sp.]THD63868.1 MAG: response regulator transcription factor [Phenylobacterium sp.]